MKTIPMADGDTLISIIGKDSRRQFLRLSEVAGLCEMTNAVAVYLRGGSIVVVDDVVDDGIGSLAALLATPLDESATNTPSPSPEDAAKASAERRRALLYRSAR